MIWQIGTGYFGCRTPEGTFSPDLFAATATVPRVTLIEIKATQSAKPGHGDILPVALHDSEASVDEIARRSFGFWHRST